MRIHATLFAALLLAACSKPSSTPDSSTPDSSTPDSSTPDSSTPDSSTPDAGGERPGLTAAACEAEGGQVVGDIGDGAVHRPEYRCADSGEAPIGSIVADPGGPVAIEGAVCCK